jgi:hypothetical protein
MSRPDHLRDGQPGPSAHQLVRDSPTQVWVPARQRISRVLAGTLVSTSAGTR